MTSSVAPIVTVVTISVIGTLQLLERNTVVFVYPMLGGSLPRAMAGQKMEVGDEWGIALGTLQRRVLGEGPVLMTEIVAFL